MYDLVFRNPSAHCSAIHAARIILVISWARTQLLYLGESIWTRSRVDCSCVLNLSNSYDKSTVVGRIVSKPLDHNHICLACYLSRALITLTHNLIIIWLWLNYIWWLMVKAYSLSGVSIRQHVSPSIVHSLRKLVSRKLLVQLLFTHIHRHTSINLLSVLSPRLTVLSNFHVPRRSTLISQIKGITADIWVVVWRWP